MRLTLKLPFNLVVTNVHTKCNKKWYCQVEGLALAAFLAVIMAIVWMNSIEDDKQKEQSCIQESGLKKDPSERFKKFIQEN